MSEDIEHRAFFDLEPGPIIKKHYGPKEWGVDFYRFHDSMDKKIGTYVVHRGIGSGKRFATQVKKLLSGCELDELDKDFLKKILKDRTITFYEGNPIIQEISQFLYPKEEYNHLLDSFGYSTALFCKTVKENNESKASENDSKG